MQELLTVLVTWLSLNFGLPAVYELPRVELVTAARMTELRLERVDQARGEPAAGVDRTPAPSNSGEVLNAIYDDSSRTVYLPEGWSSASAADVSLLVHELVHHLQNVGGLTYACAGERERPAYRAQDAWLKLHGKSVAEAFDIDAMTLLVRTNCMR